MFECKCKRCEDPTELGTYFGGIYCPKCNDFTPDGTQKEMKGILYQVNPSDWKCNQCNATLPGEECKTILKRLYDSIQRAIADSQGSAQVMELVNRLYLANDVLVVRLSEHFLC